MVIKIDQVLPVLIHNDAIGDEVRNLRDILKKLGYNSNIYTRVTTEETISYTYLDKSIERIIIYHYSTWDETIEYILKLPCKKIFVYHNITPHYFYNDCNINTASALKKAREKLPELRDKFDFVITKSNYSAQELIENGYKNVYILPYVIDFNRYRIKYSEIPVPKNIKYKILYVGRVAPHKKVDELIKIFYFYCKNISTDSFLSIVGDYTDVEPYNKKLRRMISYLKLENVFFAGNSDLKTVSAYYNWADIFVIMSRHEGFCIPIVESMYFGLPVIAYNSSAIPETLGGTGILINNNNYPEIAEIIKECIDNKELKNKIINKQKERLKDFSYTKTTETFKNYIEKIIKL